MIKSRVAKVEAKQNWTKPTLKPLGTIKDVAGNNAGACQGGGANCQARS
jgi:hypothetical protein